MPFNWILVNAPPGFALNAVNTSASVVGQAPMAVGVYPVAVAVHAYIDFPRERTLGASSIRIAKEMVIKFGPRFLNDIQANASARDISDRSLHRKPGQKQELQQFGFAAHRPS